MKEPESPEAKKSKIVNPDRKRCNSVWKFLQESSMPPLAGMTGNMQDSNMELLKMVAPLSTVALLDFL